jgi:hypothetical protein
MVDISTGMETEWAASEHLGRVSHLAVNANRSRFVRDRAMI